MAEGFELATLFLSSDGWITRVAARVEDECVIAVQHMCDLFVQLLIRAHSCYALDGTYGNGLLVDNLDELVAVSQDFMLDFYASFTVNS